MIIESLAVLAVLGLLVVAGAWYAGRINRRRLAPLLPLLEEGAYEPLAFYPTGIRGSWKGRQARIEEISAGDRIHAHTKISLATSLPLDLEWAAEEEGARTVLGVQVGTRSRALTLSRQEEGELRVESTPLIGRMAAALEQEEGARELLDRLEQSGFRSVALFPGSFRISRRQDDEESPGPGEAFDPDRVRRCLEDLEGLVRTVEARVDERPPAIPEPPRPEQRRPMTNVWVRRLLWALVVLVLGLALGWWLHHRGTFQP